MIPVTSFTYNKETKTFVSDIHNVSPTKNIVLMNYITNNTCSFNLIKIDTDTDGDIYGYRYL